MLASVTAFDGPSGATPTPSAATMSTGPERPAKEGCGSSLSVTYSIGRNRVERHRNSSLAQTDLVALAESLAMGLDTGATFGEVIVVETIDVSTSAVIPTAVEPTEHTAAIVIGYTAPPEVRNATRGPRMYAVFRSVD